MIILCNSPLKKVTRCPLMFGRQTALIRVNLAHLNQDASYITVLPFVSSFFYISLRCCDLITIAECIVRIETAPAYHSGKTYIEKLRCERNSNRVFIKGHRVQNRGVSRKRRLMSDQRQIMRAEARFNEGVNSRELAKRFAKAQMCLLPERSAPSLMNN